ncbi:phospholipase D family protein [Thiobacillus sp.]|uniref:phospholipase D family protein n=1 Tax=Thiobacillus sp. TaxID=924 RepID=UPI0025D60F83|nr:phospholipase D family protein [Thiobacillus sp.]
MNAGLRHKILKSLVLLCLPAAVAGCHTLPSLDGRSSSTALADTDATRLGRAIAPQAAAHPDRSGVYPLLDSRDAFAARVLLARAAERSLDVQYYIWRQDMAGTLLFEALHEAAERGVRVRLLLDDHNTGGLDETLAALDTHPNIEVRLFNPFATRGVRWIGYLTDFSRLNRRMHNKSFTADSQATIIGGRNVGDEYFDATEGIVFVDLDLLAVGTVVEEVSRDFDRYWASASSYPVDRLLPPADPALLEQLASKASLIERDPAARTYMEALRESPFVRELVEGTLPFEWAATRMVSDDPAKGLGLNDGASILPSQLDRIIGKPETSVELVSAYFVPTKSGTEQLTRLAREGVKIQILTNALEATDVAVVHAGYAKRRKPLLEAGITLYELQRLSPNLKRDRRAGGSGSSGASLHAKTFAVDRSRVFVGSFNFDPRSARLNTELGFVVESPALAGRIEEAFVGGIPAGAYEVRLSETGNLYWIEHRDGRPLRHETEPGTGFWKRVWIWFASLLPIEWLL